MLLKSLRLHNIRSYSTQEVHFPAGTTLLSGDIGCGKSTILLAIEFALFGILRGFLHGSTLLRHGKNQGMVELKFEVDGKEYAIKRTLKRGKTNITQDAGSLITEGKQFDLTAVELKTRILELLGYPKELLTKSKSLIFRYTVYTPQEEMKKILFEDAEARLDTLRKVFDIDKYKRVKDNSQIYVRSLKERQKRLQGIIEDLPQKEQHVKDKQQLAKEVEGKALTLDPVKKDLQLMIKQKQEELDDLMETIKQATKLKGELEQLDKESFKKSEQAMDLKAKLKELQEDTKDLPKLDLDIKEVEKSLDEKREKRKQLEKDIEAVRKNKEVYQSKLNEVKSQADILDLQSKQTQELLQQQSVDLERKTGVQKALVEELKDVKDVEEVKSATDINKQKIAELDQTLVVLRDKVSQLKSQQVSANEIISKMSTLQECPLCLQEVAHDHKQSMLKKQQDKISEVQVELSQQESQLAIKEKEHKMRVNMQEQLQNQMQQAHVLILKQEQFTENKTQIGKLQLQISELRQKSKEQNAKKQEITEQIGTAKFNLNEADKRLQEKQQLYTNILVEVDTEENKLKQWQQFQIDIKNHEESLNKIKTISAQIEAVEKEQLTMSQGHSALKQQLEEFKSAENDHALSKQELLKLQEQERDVDIQKEGYLKEKQTIELQIKELEKEVEQRRASKKQLEGLQQRQQWLEEHFIKLTELMEKHVMMSVYHQFNGLFQQWFRILIEDELLSARLDNTFAPVIEQNGYETNLDNLSGGEKTACALAYRLALNKVINDFCGNIKTKDLIILDEPTDGFSTEQLDKVREVLDQLNLKQVLIVSHENKVESFVDAVLKVQKEEHVSRVVG